MGLTTREKILLVLCCLLVLGGGGLEIMRRRAERDATDCLLRLERVEGAARAWRAASAVSDSLLERERQERQELWETHDALKFTHDSLINTPRHARPRPPRTAAALRESILRASRER